MIAILQRVTSAKVYINQKIYNEINQGLLVLLWVNQNDTEKDIDYLIKKITQLRIFNDSNDKMNLSITDIKGYILIISQFTLLSDTTKGRRPSFINAAKPDLAEKLYDSFINKIKQCDLNIKTGKFGAMMDINLINNGPATFILNSNN